MKISQYGKSIRISKEDAEDFRKSAEWREKVRKKWLDRMDASIAQALKSFGGEDDQKGQGI